MPAEVLESRALLSAVPAFSQSSYDFTIPENSTNIGGVSATDDGAICGYMASDSNFWIDGSGTISTMLMLDYESLATNPITFTVTVCDDEMQMATATVSITVTNVAEDPIFNPTSYTFSVAETAASGTVVGSLSATDPQNDIFGYSLSGSSSDSFSIDTTGKITVNGMLDFEGTPTHNLTATVYDMQGSASATVTINVTDVDENPVFNPTSYTFAVPENAAVGTVVGTVLATDPQNDICGYSVNFVGVGGTLPFYADSMGNIILSESLDFETTEEYALTAAAYDMQGCGIASVTINVTDVADQAAIADAGLDDDLAASSATLGNTLHLYGAGSYDPDSGPSPLTYNWSYNGTSLGTSASPNVTWKTLVGLGWVVGGSYEVTLEVDDDPNTPGASTDTVRIAVVKPTVIIELSDGDARESAVAPNPGQFKISCRPLEYPLPVTYQVQGDATPGAVGVGDYTPFSTTITLPVAPPPTPNVVNESAAYLDVDITNDQIVELAQSVIIRLNSSAYYDVPSDVATLIINDNDSWQWTTDIAGQVNDDDNSILATTSVPQMNSIIPLVPGGSEVTVSYCAEPSSPSAARGFLTASLFSPIFGNNNHTLNLLLDRTVDFEFNSTSGNISLKSVSQESSDATDGIFSGGQAYVYEIDNAGALEHTVDVTFTAIVAANYTVAVTPNVSVQLLPGFTVGASASVVTPKKFSLPYIVVVKLKVGGVDDDV